MNNNIHSQTLFSELWAHFSKIHIPRTHTPHIHNITSLITDPTLIRHSTLGKGVGSTQPLMVPLLHGQSGG